jgi:putative phosphoesterase
VEALWNTGDFVGYGIYPDEVVRRLRREGALSVIGNYDVKALKFPRKKDKWRRTKQPLKWLAFQWAYEHLSKKSRRYLRSLPEEVRLVVEGHNILLTHGSPESIEEPLNPDTPTHRLHELAQMAEADVILCGHSHRPFTRQEGDVWFVNPGSVGRPDDGDPRASYAILEMNRDIPSVEHHRVGYDVERAAAEVRESGLPEAFAQMVLEGRSLNALQPGQWVDRRFPD